MNYVDVDTISNQHSTYSFMSLNGMEWNGSNCLKLCDGM